MSRHRRRLVAVLACRADGTRLYGKPLQNLLDGTTILGQIVAALRTFDCIDEIVLAASSGSANVVFRDVAQDLGCKHMEGHPTDVLARVIDGAHVGSATDVFRVTTECPFFDYSQIERAWMTHLRDDNDVTVLDFVPLGTGFEIFRVEALERSHSRGGDEDRSELLSRYAKTHPGEFRLEILEPAPDCRRTDLRITVDYPEDLVVCRALAEHVRDLLPVPPLATLIQFLDANPQLVELVRPYAMDAPLWADGPQWEARASGRMPA